MALIVAIAATSLQIYINVYDSPRPSKAWSVNEHDTGITQILYDLSARLEHLCSTTRCEQGNVAQPAFLPDVTEVSAEVTSALLNHRDNDGLHFTRAMLASLQGDQLTSLFEIEVAKTLVPSDPLYAVGYINALHAVGRFDEAQRQVVSLLQRYPWLVFDNWFQDMKERDPSLIQGALRDAEDQARRSSHEVEVNMTLGWLYLYEGRFVDARPLFETAVQQVPGFGRAWIGLALINSEGGNSQESARACLIGRALGVQSAKVLRQSTYIIRAANEYHNSALLKADIIPKAQILYTFALAPRYSYEFDRSCPEINR